MSEAFERDVIDRLARIETTLSSLGERVKRVENGHSRAWVINLSGVGGMGGLIALLKLIGWL